MHTQSNDHRPPIQSPTTLPSPPRPGPSQRRRPRQWYCPCFLAQTSLGAPSVSPVSSFRGLGDFFQHSALPAPARSAALIKNSGACRTMPQKTNVHVSTSALPELGPAPVVSVVVLSSYSLLTSCHLRRRMSSSSPSSSQRPLPVLVVLAVAAVVAVREFGIVLGCVGNAKPIPKGFLSGASSLLSACWDQDNASCVLCSLRTAATILQTQASMAED